MSKTLHLSHPEQQETRPLPPLPSSLSSPYPRIRWWQSISWRLALGSMSLALLATVLLALSVIFAIIHYYSIDQRTRLSDFASDSARRIGLNYTHSSNLFRASANTFSNTLEQNYHGEQYLLIVLNHHNPPQPAYPRFGAAGNTLTEFYIALADPTLRNKSSFTSLRSAIVSSEQGVTSTGELG